MIVFPVGFQQVVICADGFGELYSSVIPLTGPHVLRFSKVVKGGDQDNWSGGYQTGWILEKPAVEKQ